MRNAILKFVTAAMIAITATYAGMSAGSAHGSMTGSGPMNGAMDGGGGGQKPK